MQQTICAKVSPKLLSRASRLFTGSMEGRIIEILQNARRAGATEVCIKNKDGFVSVQDNGYGIDDFQELLDLGSSGWDEKLEAGEDPAGVGLFSLAPREVSITSGNRTVTIKESGWTGEDINIRKAAKTIDGTELRFKDDKRWDFDAVQKQAVFSGMKVIVDGKCCHSMPFCSKDAAVYPDIGCKVEVVTVLSDHHRKWKSSYYGNNVLVNFHGQVVELDHWPGKTRSSIHVLVDLTEQTQIRLMLPARTKLVENEALEKLKEAIEIEYYRYFQCQKEHSLYYDEYLRAKELGIELPEAREQYNAGLINDEYAMAIEVFPAKDFKLAEGYLCINKDLNDETDSVNVHLLAALGETENKPFVPVDINRGYIGYSWTNLPTIASIKVTSGKERLRQMIRCYDLVCVESLSITVVTSNGNTYSSDVSMAMVKEPQKEKCRWNDETVYITEAALGELSADNIWYHLGGFNDEGDTYDTQQYDVEQQLDEFWSELIGPHEQLRHDLVKRINLHNCIYGKWNKVTVEENGTVTIRFKDSNIETVKRPAKD